ncbi:MFS transporter [Fructilactobacillus myrtifloralis]|uniref:MFS transporter n=1 Tax=Fructilactobacillus myrtifloralis TaxID=2940301 RepID=A0ABY5BNI6_9LACO|nr:MFS transporter [Fructilactobacillus myrtifloralis]USS84667.1 MFS transporter [Fructilactobacillus myrtifloralis]
MHFNQFTKYQKRVSLSTGIGFVLERMDSAFIGLALASIIATLHITKAEGGLIPSITAIGSLFGGIGFGILADKFGRVKTLSWSIFIYALGTAGMGLTNSFFMLCLFRIIIGIGTSGEYGIALTMLSEAFAKKCMGRISSAAGVAGQLGAVLASLLAAFIIPHYGWHLLFFVGIFPVILAWFIRFHLPESADFKHNHELAQTKKVQLGDLWSLFSTPREASLSIRIIIMFLIHIAGYTTVMNWLPTIAQERMHVNVASSSVWMVFTIIGMAAGIAVFGYLQDRFGSRLAFGLYLLGSAASVYLLIMAQTKIEFVAAGTIVGFLTDGMYSGYGAVVSSLYPSKNRATANNTIMSIAKTIGTFTPVLIGFIMDVSTITMVVVFMSGCYLVSFVVMMSIKQLRKGHPRYAKNN